MANGIMCTFSCYSLVTLRTHKVRVHPSSISRSNLALSLPPFPSLSLSLSSGDSKHEVPICIL